MLQNLKNFKILFKNYEMRYISEYISEFTYMRSSERRCKLSE